MVLDNPQEAEVNKIYLKSVKQMITKRKLFIFTKCNFNINIKTSATSYEKQYYLKKDLH